MDHRIGTRLRAQLATAPRSGPGRGIPHSLREQAAQYAAHCTAQGTPLTQTAEELGVSSQSLRRWMSAAARDAFAPVHLADAHRATFTVHGPAGVRIEGLDLDAVASLLRALAS